MTLLKKTESEITTNEEVVSGDIYIGGGETEAMRAIARIAKNLQRDYPQIRYHLYSGNADDVTERLDKGLLDFGILIGSANTAKYDCIRLPVSDVWGVLMRKDSPLASREAIEPKDLRELPLISSRQTLVSKDISQWLKKDYETLNLVATYNLVYNASLMVEEGVGYALSLDKLVNTTGGSNLCFRPLKPRLEAKLDIVWKKYQVFSKAADLFRKRLYQEFSLAE